MKDRGGFTFIELLVALTIFSTVAAALAGTLAQGILAWKRLGAQAELTQQARVTLDQMARDLRHGLPVPGAAFEGSSDAVVFYTARTDSVARVTYKVGSMPESPTEQVLLRKEKSMNADASTEEAVQLLTARPARLAFQFPYNPAPASDSIQWQSRWTDKKSLPPAVRVTLTLLSADGKEDEASFTRTLELPAGEWGSWKG